MTFQIFPDRQDIWHTVFCQEDGSMPGMFLKRDLFVLYNSCGQRFIAWRSGRLWEHLLRPREIDREAAAFARHAVAFHLYAASMQVRQFLDQRQPQARPFILTAVPTAHLNKRLE